MRLIPKTKPDRIAFFNCMLGPWSVDPPAIGTTPSAVADLEMKVAAARAKLAAQRAAEQAAQTATRAADHAIAAMVEAGGDIIKAIRARAAAVDGNSVYVLAQIPPPKSPSPVNTLGQPSRFAVELAANGALALKWKCKNPRASGTVYQVWRSLDHGASFTFAGATGHKRFVDNALPAGTPAVLYKVQAVRSTATGPCAMFSVQFGGGSGGPMAMSVQPKMAA